MKYVFFRYAISLLLLLLTVTAGGQEIALRRYSMKDGMPGTEIYHLFQDSYGFLWVGAKSGLGRFDGKSFKNYGYKQGLENLWVMSVYEDPLRRLWVGTNDMIFQLKGNDLKKYALEKGASFRWFFQFEFFGQRLVALTDRGAFCLEDSMWKRTYLLAGFEKYICRQIVTVPEGSFFNYGNLVLFQSGKGNVQIIAESPDKNNKTYFNYILKVNSRVFISSGNTLYEITDKTLSPLISNIPTTGYFSYALDKDFNCWISIDNKGIFYYRLQNNKYSPAYHLPFLSWIRPYIDRENTVWWGSFEGLYRSIPRLFEEVLNKNTDTSITQINNIISLGENELLLAVIDKGFYRYRNGKLIPEPRPSSYKNNQEYFRERIDGYTTDGVNTWFYTRFRHLFLWDGHVLSDKTHLLDLKTGEYFYSMAINPVTHQPYICGDSTLLVFDGQAFSPYKDKEGTGIPDPYHITFISNGTGIVGTSNGEIKLITPQNKIIAAPLPLRNTHNSIPNLHSSKFFADDNNSFWIANAGKGLNYYQMNDKFEITAAQTISRENGLPDDIVHQIITDEQGRKWVITNSGLSVLYRKNGNHFNWEVFNLSKTQGLINEEWSSANFTKVVNGTIWLASTDNIIKIKTDQLAIDKKIPKIVFEEVLLNMKETNWSQYNKPLHSHLQIPANLRLKHTQNSLGIRFKGISWGSASPLEYSYQLEPLDTGWSNASGENFVSLVRLNPGHYTLKVRVREISTGWSQPEAFSFTILPPFWMTWWFRFSLLLIAILVIVIFLYTRIKKINKKAAIQNQIADLEMKALKSQMNPHFIYNALNSIQALIASNNNNDAMMYIGSFSRLLRQVLEHSDNHVIPLEREIETMKLYISLEALRLNMNLSYSIKADESLLIENEKIPPLILQPFIENALWHGLSEKKGERILEIKISRESDWLVCVVEDNGIGRELAKRKKGQATHFSKGIDITRQRLIIFNQDKEDPLVFTDLLDGTGNPAGTRVMARIRRSAP